MFAKPIPICMFIQRIPLSFDFHHVSSKTSKVNLFGTLLQKLAIQLKPGEAQPFSLSVTRWDSPLILFGICVEYIALEENARHKSYSRQLLLVSEEDRNATDPFNRKVETPLSKLGTIFDLGGVAEQIDYEDFSIGRYAIDEAHIDVREDFHSEALGPSRHDLLMAGMKAAIDIKDSRLASQFFQVALKSSHEEILRKMIQLIDPISVDSLNSEELKLLENKLEILLTDSTDFSAA
jgi:hypothetical protein